VSGVDSRVGSLLTVHRACSERQQTKETMIHFVLMRCLLLASTMGPSLDGRSALGSLFVWLSWLTLLRGLLTLCKARFQHVRTAPPVYRSVSVAQDDAHGHICWSVSS
jgi:hypothetical protein